MADGKGRPRETQPPQRPSDCDAPTSPEGFGLLHELVFNAARDIILFVGKDGAILDANDAALVAYGYSREELLARSIYDLRAPQTAKEVSSQMTKAGDGGILFESVHCRKTGDCFPVEVSSRGVSFAGREILLSIIRDISERKTAERRLSETTDTLRAIVDASPLPIVALGLDYRVMLWNPAAERVFGWRAEEVVGKLYPLVPEEGREEFRAEFAHMLAGHYTQGMELRRKRRDGSIIDTELWTSVLKDSTGAKVGVVGVLVDITLRKQVEAERERLLTQMEEFVSIVSHDLKSPLTVIQGQAQMLQRVAQKPALVQKSAESIRSGAQRMATMISDLAEAARLESGHLDIEMVPLDLAWVVSEWSQRLQTARNIRRIKLEISDFLPPILGDLVHVERVLTNLVGNALKYSEGEVLVSANPNGGEVVVSVKDRGVGIPREDLPRLFSRYYRSKGTRKAEGMGLGLYITRGLVEALGGRIWVESEIGKGSTFYFTLPASLPEPEIT